MDTEEAIVCAAGRQRSSKVQHRPLFLLLFIIVLHPPITANSFSAKKTQTTRDHGEWTHVWSPLELWKELLDGKGLGRPREGVVLVPAVTPMVELGGNSISRIVKSILSVKSKVGPSLSSVWVLVWELWHGHLGQLCGQSRRGCTKHCALMEDPCSPQPVGWPVPAGSGGEKTLVRDGASLWEGFWLPSQSCTEVRPTAARCQDGVWRRTRIPAIGLLLTEPPLLEPAGGLSSMGVQEGGYVSWRGFWLLSWSHTGARHTAPRCLWSLLWDLSGLSRHCVKGGIISLPHGGWKCWEPPWRSLCLLLPGGVTCRWAALERALPLCRRDPQSTLRAAVAEPPWHASVPASFHGDPEKTAEKAQISFGRQIIGCDSACGWGWRDNPAFILLTEFRGQSWEFLPAKLGRRALLYHCQRVSSSSKQ